MEKEKRKRVVCGVCEQKLNKKSNLRQHETHAPLFFWVVFSRLCADLPMSIKTVEKVERFRQAVRSVVGSFVAAGA